MSKHYNIRWTDADQQELKRVVKNFNAKISRLEKKLTPNEKRALPERVTVKQMKELIDTRQDLKRELNALKRFSKKGAEEIVTVPNTDYNITTTKWQKQEMTRRVAIINRRRKKRLEEIQDIEMTSRREPLGYTIGDIGMGDIDQIALTPMKPFTPRMTRTELRYKYESILRESQSTYWSKTDARLKENFMNAILSNYKEDDVKDIIEEIDKMDFKEFYTIFKREGGFELVYFATQEEYESHLTALRVIWLPDFYHAPRRAEPEE